MQPLKALVFGAVLVGSSIVQQPLAADGGKAINPARAFARQTSGLSPQVLSLALHASHCASAKEAAPEARYLAVIDYSLPSTEQRFWLFDTTSRKLIRKDYVAHGRNSGKVFATRFSNIPGSLQSSLGLYYTGDTYMGRHGYSLRLHGLEPGINDLALDRAIVLHGAHYVGPSFIRRHHRSGLSWGCPVLPARSAPEVIDVLKEGAFLFVYYPDRRWLQRSPYLACHIPRDALQKRLPSPSRMSYTHVRAPLAQR